MFEELTPPYATIVADPPWPYPGEYDNKRPDEQWQRGVNDTGYSPIPMAELRAFSVESLAADNAHLYVWTTNSFMVEAHELARSWGFRPKTILTWVKVHQDDPLRVSMKTGYHFRGASEHVVFAVRGSLRLMSSKGQPTAYLWPRIGRHSVKPAAFFDLVESVSPGPRVELFSRSPRLGWDSWGYGYEGVA